MLTFGDVKAGDDLAIEIIRKLHGQILKHAITHPITPEQRQEVDTVLSALIDSLNHLRGRGVAVPGLYTDRIFGRTPFHTAAEDLFTELKVVPEGNDIEILADDIRLVAEQIDSDSITAARELRRRIGGSLSSYIKCIRPKEGR